MNQEIEMNKWILMFFYLLIYGLPAFFLSTGFGLLLMISSAIEDDQLVLLVFIAIMAVLAGFGSALSSYKWTYPEFRNFKRTGKSEYIDADWAKSAVLWGGIIFLVFWLISIFVILNFLVGNIL